MNTELFREMHQIFKKHTGIRRKTEFFLYLIRKEDKDPLSSKLYKYINGDRTNSKWENFKDYTREWQLGFHRKPFF